MLKRKVVGRWVIVAEPNEDYPGMNVWLDHASGDSCSLACGDSEGETVDGLIVPRKVVDAAYKWIEEEGIDY